MAEGKEGPVNPHSRRNLRAPSPPPEIIPLKHHIEVSGRAKDLFPKSTEIPTSEDVIQDAVNRNEIPKGPSTAFKKAISRARSSVASRFGLKSEAPSADQVVQDDVEQNPLTQQKGESLNRTYAVNTMDL